MSKLSDFLDKNKISVPRLITTSKRLERLTPADRKVRLAKRRVKGGSPSDAEKEIAEGKGGSGRPVTKPTLDRALSGKEVAAKAKQRITRAINHLLKQKKKSEVSAADLF